MTTAVLGQAARAAVRRAAAPEGLRGGVQAKQGLWDSLAELAKHDDRLDALERSLALSSQRQLMGRSLAAPKVRVRSAGPASLALLSDQVVPALTPTVSVPPPSQSPTTG